MGFRRSRNGVRVVVADTGIGIPQKQQKTIFKEFQRLEQGARIERGLGLGLSIVERIVKVLDLKLDLASESGKGSTFTLHLPRTGIPRRVGTTEAEPVAPAPASLAGRKILVIDNEPTILDGMRRLLEGWSCEVITAADAEQAMKAFKGSKSKPDVMLVDYHLDESNGIDAVLKLRWRFRSIVPPCSSRRSVRPKCGTARHPRISRSSTSQSSRRPCARCWCRSASSAQSRRNEQ